MKGGTLFLLFPVSSLSVGVTVVLNVLPGTRPQFTTLRLLKIRVRLTRARFATVVQQPVTS